MTVVIEVGKRANWKPGRAKSNCMYRFWWLWFAVSFLRISFSDYSTTIGEWNDEQKWTK